MGTDPWKEAADTLAAAREGASRVMEADRVAPVVPVAPVAPVVRVAGAVVTPARGVPVVPAPARHVQFEPPVFEPPVFEAPDYEPQVFAAPVFEAPAPVVVAAPVEVAPVKGRGRKRGRKAAAAAAVADVAPVVESASAGPAQTVRWTGGNALASKFFTFLISLALVTGPVGLGWSLLRGSVELAPATVESEPVEWDASSLAAERGRELVTAWLTATRTDSERLQALYGSAVTGLPQSAPQVQDVAVAQVSAAGEGLWSVLVGADVLAAAPTEKDPAAQVWVRQFFQVPLAVAQTDAGLGVQVLGLPAPMPAPVTASGAKAAYTNRLAATGLVADSVSGFLGALLTGQGELTRYVTPGTALTAISPAPYTGVELVSVSTVRTDVDVDAPAQGDQVAVLADVSLVRADGQETRTSYALSLTARDGRWEVSSVDETPVISGADAPVQQNTPAQTPGTEATSTTGPNDGGNA